MLIELLKSVIFVFEEHQYHYWNKLTHNENHCEINIHHILIQILEKVKRLNHNPDNLTTRSIDQYSIEFGFLTTPGIISKFFDILSVLA